MSSKTSKGRSIVVTIILVLGTLVMAAPPQGMEQGGSSPPKWPEENEWINYTFKGERVRDWEDKPYETDPTYGFADVNPETVDIASGVDASGGGPENNPGYYTSVQYFYNDTQGDSDNFTNLDDDWLFFRMRLADDPRHGGKFAYKAYHWDILIEVDYDEWKEIVIDLNGQGYGAYQFGSIGVFYNNSDTHEYNPDMDEVWLKEASADSNLYTRPMLIDYGDMDKTNDQWWIEYRIPVTAFKDKDGNQLIGYGTYFLLFFSTSASNTNPLQKDWMGEFVFGEPPEIVVEKIAQEEVVSPGDTIHYTIHYNNTGDFASKYVWVNDTIPDGTTFDSCYPPYNSTDGNVIRWAFEDVMPGNHSILLNVTVDAGVGDGTILRNWAYLNYTDSAGNNINETKDFVDVFVTGPTMEFSKSASTDYANPGDVITYTLTYSNIGAGIATDVTIVDTIPSDTSFVNSSPNYNSSLGDTYTWDIGTVGGYITGQILINITVDANTQDNTILVNYATMDFKDINGHPQDQLDGYANVTVTAPLMTIAKSANAQFADPGDMIVYTITYKNLGNGTAYNVVIVDTLSDNVSYSVAIPAPSNINGQILTWNLTPQPGNSSGSITINVIVNIYTPDQTVLVNLATLNYEDPNDNPYPEESDYANVTVTAPIMTISKTANASTANPGDSINYTITYHNTGSGGGTSVVIVDTLSDNVTYVSASPTPSNINGQVLTWNLGSVAGYFNGTINITVTVNAYTPDQTVLANYVTLNYKDANGNPYPEESDYANVTLTAPIVTISKTADVTTVNPGDQINYTITYQNNGSGEAVDVVIVDTLPDNVTYVSATPTPTNISGKILTWIFPSVAGNSGGTIIITVTVDAYTPDQTVLSNEVTLNYNDTNDNPYEEEDDSVNVTVTAPFMTVSKTASVPTADPGDQIIYTITYQNTGSGEATDVVIIDTLPDNVTYVGATPTPSNISGQVLKWIFPSVAGNSSGTITIIVKVDAYTPDHTILENNVTLNYNDTNDNPYEEEDDSVNVTVTAPLMTISKTASVSTADPDDQIIYTITYQNNGTGEATDVVIVDTLPNNVTYVSATPTPTNISGQVLKWVFPSVAGNTGGTITITVTVDDYTADQTVLENDVTLNYNDTNDNPYEEEDDSVNVTVTAPLMTISKSADVPTADPGDQINYTLIYENKGSGEATDVVIIDTLPDNVTYMGATPTPYNINGQVLKWVFPSVAGNSSGTITITVTVDSYSPDQVILHNVVTLDYDDANGNPYPQETDYANVTLTAPMITISKTADVSTADPGDQINYTITYQNNGSGEATDVFIVDTLPDNVTYVSATPAPTNISGQVLKWVFPSVAGNSGGNITITVTVDVYTADQTVLSNEVTLNYNDTNDNPYEEEDDSVNVTVTAPIMTITKSADVPTADPGDQINYTLFYENAGSGEATGVVIVDTLPDNVTYVSATPTPTNISGKVLKWVFPSVAGYSNGTITITVTVDSYTPDQTVMHNYVTLNYNDTNDNPYPEETDYANVTLTAPIITISKSADVSTADPGDQINYTIFYENTGYGEATDVVIVDTLPDNVTYVSATPTPTNISGQVLKWVFPSVTGNSNGTITITVTVDAYTADETVLTNDVTLNYNDTNDNPFEEEDDSVNVTVTAPIMTITKSADVPKADPGDQINYTITYKNDGTGEATGVVIVDTLPDNVTYVSATPTPTNISGQVLTWVFPSVADNSSGNITVTVTVDAYTADETVLENDVTLNYNDTNDNPYEEEDDSVNVTVTAPIMTITKSADVPTADPNDQINYTIAYKNDGTGEATGVVIVDTLPDNVTYVSATPIPTNISGQILTWIFPSIAGNSSGNITITVSVNSYTPDGTVLFNEVILNYNDTNNNPYEEESDFVNVTVTAPTMTILKSADNTTADPSDQIIYTIFYENTATGEATDVVIIDTLPDNVTYVSATPTPTNISGQVLKWVFPSVAGDSNGTITITVTVDAYTPDLTILYNVVTLNYNDTNDNPFEEESDFVNVTVTAPVMTFYKTADTLNADPSDTIIYTIYYENTGSGNATDVVVIDIIPSDVTVVSTVPAANNVSGNIYTWNIGNLSAGGSGTITITVTVNIGVDDGTLLVNLAKYNYSDANGNPYAQMRDYANVTVTAPVMTFTKNADRITANPSDTIIYTIKYNNTGSGNATDVIVTDIISSDVTVVSTNPIADNISGNTYTWNIGNLSAFTSGTITITVTVNVGVDDGKLLVNFATYNYSDANGNPYDQMTDYANVTVTAPVMTFSKIANRTTANPSDVIVYTIQYNNTGSGDATDVIVTDIISSDVTVVNTVPTTDNISGNTYTWNIGNLSAFSNGTITITVTVNVGVDDGKLLVNFATYDYSDTNHNPYDQMTDYANVTVTAPVMTFNKIANRTTADPSDVIVYTIEYNNTGSGNATDVVVTDTIPSDVTFNSSIPMWDNKSGNTYIWNIGNLSAFTRGIITITVIVNVAVDDGKLLVNFATYDYSDANHNPYDQMTDYANVTVTAPNMTVQKYANRTTANPSDYINYTIYYDNSGSGEATDIHIVDTIPANTTFISSDPGFDWQNGDIYWWNFTSIPGYTNGTITIKVQVDAYTPDGKVLTNSVTLDYDDANGNPYPQKTDLINVTVTAPVMTITKVASVTLADPGDNITYTLNYTNSGSGRATGVVVTDTIPENTTFVGSVPADPGLSGNTYTWNIGTVNPYSYGIITITVTVDAGTPDGKLLRNNCTLDYDDANGNPYTQEKDHADVVVTAPVMNITKTADVPTADPDDLITYTIVFTNSGTGNATNVWINDTIPACTTLVSTTPAYNFNDSANDTYMWLYNLIGSSSQVTITIVVRVDVGTPDRELLHNSVILEYSDDNGNPLDPESAFANVNVTAPVMSVIKTADKSTANPGDTINYTITYNNTGTGWASGVYLNDTIPGYTSFVSSKPPNSNVSGSIYIWNLMNIAPSTTFTICIKVIVHVPTPDFTLLHNVVTLDYADANGNYYPREDDYADTRVTAPVMSFNKTSNVSDADCGDYINYTITYYNSGHGWASGVYVNDTIPDDTIFISATPVNDSSSGRNFTWFIDKVAPSSGGSIKIKVQVIVGTPDTTLLHNTATFDYADANGNYYPQKSDYADVTVTAPVMSFNKSVENSTADPDDYITYTITYYNNGTGWASGVYVNDTIPDDTVFISATPTNNSSSGRNYTWIIGNLAPKTGGSITIILKVVIGTPDKTLLHNKATYDYADANGNYYTQMSSYADVTVTAPVMSFNKSVENSTADPDDYITYTITYYNNGTGWASGVYVNDTIPDDTIFICATPTNDSSSGRNYTWIIGNLAPKSGGSITIVLKVVIGTPDTTLLHNTATYDYADANGNYYPQMSSYADVVVTAPVMSFNKTVENSTADPGDYITYTIYYYNNGTGWATGVYVNDTIPDDTYFISATPNATNSSGRNYTWFIGNLAPKSGGSIVIVIQVVPLIIPDKTLLHNEATMDYADANGNYYPRMKSYADVVVTAPELSLNKTVENSTSDPGDYVTYTLTAHNNGTGNASGVYINDTIPAHLTFVSSNINYSYNSGTFYEFYIGDVGAGVTVTVIIILKVDPFTPDQTTLHNDATCDYADVNGNYYPQLDDSADSVVTAPILAISKISITSSADPGDYFNYTITYYNNGTGWASGIYVNDTIPDETIFISTTPANDSSSGRNYTWFIGNVAPKSGGSIEIMVQVIPRTPDQTVMVNKATLDYADANGNYYPQLDDYANVTVTAPVMSFNKIADNTTADPENYITYTITYYNNGTGWASGVYINDTIPEHTVFINSTPNSTSSIGRNYTWFIGNVAPTSSASIQIVVQVLAGTADKTHLPNFASFDHADTNGNYYDRQVDWANITVTAPIMLVNKTVDVSTVDPGDPITYDITYENAGTGWARGFFINDTIPYYTTFANATPNYTSWDGKRTYHWWIGHVPPLSLYHIYLTVIVDPHVPDELILENKIGNVSANVTVTAPIMAINKTANRTTADPGDYILYTIKYNNTGTGNASGVYINDTIPEHTTFVTSSINYTYNSGRFYEFFIDFVGAKSSAFFTITVMVDPGTEDKTLLTNNVTLDYADANGNYYNRSYDWANVTVTAPIMFLNKTADVLKADPGDTIVYTIKYNNTGTGNASNVIIVDTLPLDVDYVSALPIPISVVGNVVTWNIGIVPAGFSGTITLNVKVKPRTPDKTLLHNVVILDYSDANGNFIERLNDYADVTVTAPDMVLSKEAWDVNVTAYVTANITLRVAGEKWHNVNLTLYDDGMIVANASITRYPGDPDDQSVTIYNVTINCLTDSLTAKVEYTPWDDPVNGQPWGADPAWLILNSDEKHEVRIHHIFNVRHEETWLWIVDDFRPYLSGLPITLNYTVAYDITYENLGTGDATNVWVYDTLPANKILINSTPMWNSHIGNTYGWFIGNVPAGAKGVITVNISYVFEDARVKSWDPNGTMLYNNASLECSDANGNFFQEVNITAGVLVFAPDELKKDSAIGYLPEGFSMPESVQDPAQDHDSIFVVKDIHEDCDMTDVDTTAPKQEEAKFDTYHDAQDTDSDMISEVPIEVEDALEPEPEKHFEIEEEAPSEVIQEVEDTVHLEPRKAIDESEKPSLVLEYQGFGPQKALLKPSAKRTTAPYFPLLVALFFVLCALAVGTDDRFQQYKKKRR